MKRREFTVKDRVHTPIYCPSCEGLVGFLCPHEEGAEVGMVKIKIGGKEYRVYEIEPPEEEGAAELELLHCPHCGYDFKPEPGRKIDA